MTLWAIKVTPIHGRGRQWIDYTTVSQLQKDAWKKFSGEHVAEAWLAEIAQRRRRGLLRAVKVTVQEVQA
ncbi:hypothetical protein [Polaromonas sp.]|uniref:hypothetical protein n=1 Tax=Polaromonas sp. TaxID=1869339 RepID=UPI003264740D